MRLEVIVRSVIVTSCMAAKKRLQALAVRVCLDA